MDAKVVWNVFNGCCFGIQIVQRMKLKGVTILKVVTFKKVTILYASDNFKVLLSPLWPK